LAFLIAEMLKQSREDFSAPKVSIAS
jgi:hypothetical protein